MLHADLQWSAFGLLNQIKSKPLYATKSVRHAAAIPLAPSFACNSHAAMKAIAIIGAGIGGLAAAALLHRAGHASQIGRWRVMC